MIKMAQMIVQVNKSTVTRRIPQARLIIRLIESRIKGVTKSAVRYYIVAPGILSRPLGEGESGKEAWNDARANLEIGLREAV